MPAIIKFSYNSDTRRRTVSTEIKFSELQEMVRETFALQNFTVKYIDEDGDTITLGSDLELKEALNMLNGAVLRLNITAAAGPPAQPPSLVIKEEEEEEEAEDEEFEMIKNSSVNNLQEAAELEAAIAASLKEAEQAKEQQEQQEEVKEEEEAQPIVALKSFLQDIVGEFQQEMGEVQEDLADDHGALQTFFKNLGEQLNGMAKSSGDSVKAAAAPHVEALRSAVDELLAKGVLAGDSLKEIYDAILASPASVQELIVSLVKLAKEQTDALEEAARAKLTSSSGVLHAAMCDHCQKSIVGVRYKCAQCVDFDLCSDCESRNANGGIHNRTHVFLKLTMPIPHNASFMMPNLYTMNNNRRRPVPASMSNHRSKNEGRGLVARFVRDLTIGDNTVLPPSSDFVKMWTVRNSGQSAWPAGCRVVHVGGDALSDYESGEALPRVEPGQEVNVAVDMRCPPRAGRYTSFWRLATQNGNRFGHRLWCNIQVEDPQAAVEEPVAAAAAAVAEAEKVEEVDDSMLNHIQRSFENLNVVRSVDVSDAEVARDLADIQKMVDEQVEAQVEAELCEEQAINDEIEVAQAEAAVNAAIEEVEEEEEEEEVKEEEVKEEEKPNVLLFTSQLRQLNNMGFGNEDKNKELLDQHQGDVLAVVQDLLADH